MAAFIVIVFVIVAMIMRMRGVIMCRTVTCRLRLGVATQGRVAAIVRARGVILGCVVIVIVRVRSHAPL